MKKRSQDTGPEVIPLGFWTIGHRFLEDRNRLTSGKLKMWCIPWGSWPKRLSNCGGPSLPKAVHPA